MELKSSIIIPERKGCNSIITIKPRMFIAEDQQVSNSTSTTDEVPQSINNPSDQVVDSDPRTNKLILIKQELKQKLGYHHNHSDSKDKPTNYSKLIPSKALFKWMIIVLNVIIELIQAVYSQDASSRQITKANYGKLSVITSSICLIISLVDIVFEAWEGGVKWRMRRFCPWFYYPGKHGRAFGSFWLVFGLVSSMVQFWLSLVGYVTNGSGSVRFDYLPLLLAVCFFLAALGGGRKSMWVVVKCDIKHGEYEIEGRFVKGSWCFACPSCETAIRSV